MEAPSLTRAIALCRGRARVGEDWISSRGWTAYAEPLAVIAVGGAAYGLSMGVWRDPMLGVIVAVKLPILLASTALVDALLNGLWARRLGLALTFAQSFRAVLAAFALASVVLAALSPVLISFALTLPGADAPAARLAHDVLGCAHVIAIAAAGAAAVTRQRLWVSRVSSGNATHAVVGVWLAVNLVVGAQLSWNLRPWFGSPGMEVELLRDAPFDGSFYESVYRMVFETES